jgi:hypothetical protein
MGIHNGTSTIQIEGYPDFTMTRSGFSFCRDDQKVFVICRSSVVRARTTCCLSTAAIFSKAIYSGQTRQLRWSRVDDLRRAQKLIRIILLMCILYAGANDAGNGLDDQREVEDIMDRSDDEAYDYKVGAHTLVLLNSSRFDNLSTRLPAFWFDASLSRLIPALRKIKQMNIVWSSNRRD